MYTVNIKSMQRRNRRQRAWRLSEYLRLKAEAESDKVNHMPPPRILPDVAMFAKFLGRMVTSKLFLRPRIRGG